MKCITERKNKHEIVYCIKLTGISHFANIKGAERTAEYYNQRQMHVFINDIREQTLNFDIRF
jgi:hypothetical protein